MYQQYINEARAAQQQQDRLREAAVAHSRAAEPRPARARGRAADHLYVLRAGVAGTLRRLAALGPR